MAKQFWQHEASVALLRSAEMLVAKHKKVDSYLVSAFGTQIAAMQRCLLLRQPHSVLKLPPQHTPSPSLLFSAMTATGCCLMLNRFVQKFPLTVKMFLHGCSRKAMYPRCCKSAVIDVLRPLLYRQLGGLTVQ
jgi:hypothetical protein